MEYACRSGGKSDEAVAVDGGSRSAAVVAAARVVVVVVTKLSSSSRSGGSSGGSRCSISSGKWSKQECSGSRVVGVVVDFDNLPQLL